MGGNNSTRTVLENRNASSFAYNSGSQINFEKRNCWPHSKSFWLLESERDLRYYSLSQNIDPRILL